MSKKFNAALGVYNMLKEKKGPLVLGIGTGSTTDYFTKEFLPKLKEKVSDLYSSSERTTKLLTDLGFTVCEYKSGSSIDIYIDGADEVDSNLNLIKGGGGAHTNEKKLAKQSKEFICIVDDKKLVNCLGAFPLPVEISIKKSNAACLSLHNFSKNVTKRERLSDNGNYLYDIHDFKIEDPNKTEKQILSIDGIVDVGIFSINKPSVVVVGLELGYRLIES